MSRKSVSFHQLIHYLDKDNASARFSWNMYSKDSNQEVINEFMDNSKHIKNKRGKIYLYHEVISLENTNLEDKKAEKILYDLADKYIEDRAKNHLVFGTVHRDTDNPHIHLVISANEVNGAKRVRLSKKEFSSIQANLEAYKNEKFKSLKQAIFMTNQKSKASLSSPNKS